MKFIDLTGKRFGKLVVIEKAEKKGKDYLWKCKCDCGTKKKILGNNLRAGYIVSCGCSIKESFKRYKEENFINGTRIDRINSTRKKQVNNTSGITGVYFNKKRKKWIAQIKFKGKVYNLGGYKDKLEAAKVRKEAEEKMFGEFIKWYKEKYNK